MYVFAWFCFEICIEPSESQKSDNRALCAWESFIKGSKGYDYSPSAGNEYRYKHKLLLELRNAQKRTTVFTCQRVKYQTQISDCARWAKKITLKNSVSKRCVFELVPPGHQSCIGLPKVEQLCTVAWAAGRMISDSLEVEKKGRTRQQKGRICEIWSRYIKIPAGIEIAHRLGLTPPSARRMETETQFAQALCSIVISSKWLCV